MKLVRENILAITVTFLLVILGNGLSAQNPVRFKKEVDSLVALNKSFDPYNVILFTGSSSIRLWKNLKSTFPRHNVLNLGFGGSEMADLLYYTDRLITPFSPRQIFIYEGDNDISFGRSSEQIISAANSILIKIRRRLPNAEVIFISPKPSLKRWKMKDKYVALNQKFKAWVMMQKNVRFADVWTPMLDLKGEVLKDIFVGDGLHLNNKGYAIWTHVIRNYLPK